MKSIVKLLIMLWELGAASINQPVAVFRSRLQLLLIEPFRYIPALSIVDFGEWLRKALQAARANRGRMMNSLYFSQVYKAPSPLFAL
jgi:hypothetical protein